MVYETSYESGRKPFFPDATRGYWKSPSDFVYASLGLAFKMDFFVGPFMPLAFYFNVSNILTYLVCMGLYVVPIFVIQAFLGQFSSSGFISAFRVTPLFKGMGYISLAVNFVVLMYYSVFAAVPLLYLFFSLRPTLPWSCEGMESWKHNISERSSINVCNMSAIHDPEWIEAVNSTSGYYDYHIPSVMFFETQIGNKRQSYFGTDENLTLSWQLVLSSFVVWGIVAGVFHKFFNTEQFGKVLRYSIWTVLALMGICLARFLFLPGASSNLFTDFLPSLNELEYLPLSIPMYTMTALGGGWGTIVSLSSFNQFKTDIMRQSWIIAFGQMFIFIGFGTILYAISEYYNVLISKTNEENDFYAFVIHHWTLYLSAGSVLAEMELAHMWSILYYTMLALAAIVVIVTQLHSLLVTIYDEFEYLRLFKAEINLGLIAVLSFCSIYFCTNNGVLFFSALSMDTLFTQTALNLLLLLVVLWIYGRERFQRDIEFMLSRRFATWKINLLRFLAPLFLLLTLLIGLVAAISEHLHASMTVMIAALFLIVLPWLFIPGYIIFITTQTAGTWRLRFRRCCRPTDWYPVEPEPRQQYEEAVGNIDTTHQLNEVS